MPLFYEDEKIKIDSFVGTKNLLKPK